MKRLKIVFVVLILCCITNLGMGITPQNLKLEKEKEELVRKLRKTLSKNCFIKFMEDGQQEQFVLRCSVNEQNKVVVSKIIGFNKELEEMIRKTIEKKAFTASSGLRGEALALHLKFKKIAQ